MSLDLSCFASKTWTEPWGCWVIVVVAAIMNLALYKHKRNDNERRPDLEALDNPTLVISSTWIILWRLPIATNLTLETLGQIKCSVFASFFKSQTLVFPSVFFNIGKIKLSKILIFILFEIKLYTLLRISFEDIIVSDISKR